MSTKGARTTTNEIVAMAEMNARLIGLVAAYHGRDSSGYNSVAFLEKAVSVPNRTKMVVDLVAGLVPADIDPECWISWINGGSIPQSVAGPTLHRRPAVTYSRQAERAWGRASKVGSEATSLEEQAAALLKKAEKLREAEAAELHASRALVLVLLLGQMHQQHNGVFAMGPAWHFLRIISKLPESERILQDIDVIGSDADFEADMGAAIVSVWRKHRDRAACSDKRRSLVNAKTSMPSGVSADEVKEVLGKLASGSEKEASVDASRAGRPVTPNASVRRPAKLPPTEEIQSPVSVDDTAEQPLTGPRTYVINGRTHIDEDIVL